MEEFINIYSAPWCTYCTRTKQMLYDAGIEFVEIDISVSPDAEQHIKDQWGAKQIPVVETEEDVFWGWHPEKVKELIEQRAPSVFDY